MSFIWPMMLVLLFLLPVLVMMYMRIQRRRQRMSELYGSLGFATSAAGSGHGPGLRRHIPPLIFLLGLALLIFSLARPQTTVDLPRVEGTVILLFDVSGSMAATDYEPTRMDAAKAAARQFVTGQPTGVQVGVVAFSDNGFAVQPPTDDQNAILAAIDRMEPQRGTSLAHGIFASLNTLGVSRGLEMPTPSPEDQQARASSIPPLPQVAMPSAAIVLLSDGENNEDPDPLAAAQAAGELEVNIHTVGIGSTAGTTLEVEGFVVHTRLDETMLKNIAAISGGNYYTAANAEELSTVYTNLGRELVIRPETTEVTSVFAGASILILLLGGVFSLLWFNRLP